MGGEDRRDDGDETQAGDAATRIARPPATDPAAKTAPNPAAQTPATPDADAPTAVTITPEPAADATQIARPPASPAGDAPTAVTLPAPDEAATEAAADRTAEPAYAPSAPPAPAAITIGTIVNDRFEITGILGRGGMSAVYAATDKLFSGDGRARKVAVKVISEALAGHPLADRILREEAINAQSLSHDHIVRVHEMHRDAVTGALFLNMDYVEGVPLEQMIRLNDPQLTPKVKLRLVTRIADALRYAHNEAKRPGRAKIVHCDIKPSNVLVTPALEPKLIDFGIARAIEHGAEADDTMDASPHAHTRAYASPLVIDGKRPDVLDDVFSLACLTYELYARERPWGKYNNARTAYLKQHRLVRPAGMPWLVWRAVCRGLQYDEKRRTQSVGAFIRQLQGLDVYAGAGVAATAAAAGLFLGIRILQSVVPAETVLPEIVPPAASASAAGIVKAFGQHLEMSPSADDRVVDQLSTDCPDREIGAHDDPIGRALDAASGGTDHSADGCRLLAMLARFALQGEKMMLHARSDRAFRLAARGEVGDGAAGPSFRHDEYIGLDFRARLPDDYKVYVFRTRYASDGMFSRESMMLAPVALIEVPKNQDIARETADLPSWSRDALLVGFSGHDAAGERAETGLLFALAIPRDAEAPWWVEAKGWTRATETAPDPIYVGEMLGRTGVPKGNETWLADWIFVRAVEN